VEGCFLALLWLHARAVQRCGQFDCTFRPRAQALRRMPMTPGAMRGAPTAVIEALRANIPVLFMVDDNKLVRQARDLSSLICGLMSRRFRLVIVCTCPKLAIVANQA
jgi:hypothetical protein